ncbi:MAG: hypothetical protein JXB50_08250 [Spirochaetes bacterium]|nr:hypothetical protein [Spirochaetota bacterium]
MNKNRFKIVFLMFICILLLSFGFNPANAQENKEAFGTFVVPDLGSPIGWASVNYLGQDGTTGGKGGEVVHVNNYDDLKTQLSSGGKKIIVVYGKIMKDPKSKDIVLFVEGNKTVIGAFGTAYLDNFGLFISGSNVIIKDLDIWNGGVGDEENYDGIQLGTEAHHVWIDHCTVHECLDGAIDPSKQNRFVTISYCYIYKQDKTMLICGNDGDSLAIKSMKKRDLRDTYYTVTVHHNVFSGTYERNPRVRFGHVHVFNNLYENIRGYSIGLGVNANIYSESNYFNNGNVVFAKYDNNDNPGYVVDENSIFEGKSYGTKNRPPKFLKRWKPSKFYNYTLHEASWIKENLKKYAGTGKSNP